MTRTVCLLTVGWTNCPWGCQADYEQPGHGQDAQGTGEQPGPQQGAISISAERRKGAGSAWRDEAMCIYEHLRDRKRLVTPTEELVGTVTQTQLLLRVLDKPPEVPWFLVSTWEC